MSVHDDDQPGATPPDRAWRNFYGRRHGKQLRKGQVRLLETRLAELAPAGVGWEENPHRRPLDLPARFGRPRPGGLEIGFGGGEHLAGLAARHPEVGFLGCEHYVDGVAKLLATI
ncbi:MAG: tRNA (guanosine(46)-N7)-methyltransferase TrmB, partial [Paracoccaceae bacterium]